MSRRAIKQDSLELLLDTICNTFGGVLFIAIMVVMLLAQSGHGPENVVPAPSPEELEVESRQLATLSSEVLRKQQILASQAALVESLAPDTIRELIDRRKTSLAELVQLQAAVDAQQAQNAAVMANVARTRAEIDKLLTQLKIAQQQESEVRTLLASEQQGRVKDARLPQQRQRGEKREILLVVRYGRLYIWHDYDLRLYRQGLNLRDFVVISDDGEELTTRPKPTAGIVLDDSPECQRAIDRLLGRFDPKQFYLAPVVRPDSYGVFRYVRDRAIALKFQYRLIPVDTEDPVADRGGSSSRVQ